MKTGTTLLLLAAAGALATWVIYSESPGTRGQAMRDAKVLHFDPEKIDKVTIRNGEETIELERDGAQWNMKAPVADKAEIPFVRQLIGISDELFKGEVIPDNTKDALKSFGLDKSRLRLELRGKGQKPPELLFGAETPVEGKTYVRHKDSDDVFVVDATLRRLVSSKADDFRQRKLFDIEVPHLHEITLETKAGKIVLVREGTEWELRQPLKARVNEAFLGELLQHLLATEVMTFIRDEGANLNALGLAEPRATLTLKSHSREEPVQLQIGSRIASGQDDVPDGLYTRLSTRESVCIVPYGMERLVTMTPDELRDRHLLRLQSDMIDRISIQEAGQPPVRFHRQSEGWALLNTDRMVDDRKVLTMIAALEKTPVSAFVSNVASDLASYGLDKPSLKITFSSYASATTAESGAGEIPIATVLFGKEEDGQIYAKVEEEPFIVALPAAILKAIKQDIVEWRDRAVFSFLPEDIHALQISYPAGPSPRAPLSLVREGAGWASAKHPAAVDSIRVESLVNTLATLIAIEWLPKLEQPMSEIQTLTFRVGKVREVTLEVGVAVRADGSRFDVGRVVGEDGFFILTAPDLSALKLPLTEVTLPGEASPSVPSPTPPQASP